MHLPGALVGEPAPPRVGAEITQGSVTQPSGCPPYASLCGRVDQHQAPMSLSVDQREATLLRNPLTGTWPDLITDGHHCGDTDHRTVCRPSPSRWTSPRWLNTSAVGVLRPSGDFELPGVVEAVNGIGPAERRLGLTNGFGTLKRHGRQTAHEFIEFGINDPGPVLHEPTTPNGRLLQYEMDAPSCSDRSLPSGGKCRIRKRQRHVRSRPGNKCGGSAVSPLLSSRSQPASPADPASRTYRRTAPRHHCRLPLEP